jgi:hypothetical protein
MIPILHLNASPSFLKAEWKVSDTGQPTEPLVLLFVTWQLLNTIIGRFELFPSAGRVVVFRFVIFCLFLATII